MLDAYPACSFVRNHPKSPVALLQDYRFISADLEIAKTASPNTTACSGDNAEYSIEWL